MKEKLHECHIQKELCNDILSDTFGKKIGSVYVEGLVDAKDPDDFQAKVDKHADKVALGVLQSPSPPMRVRQQMLSYKKMDYKRNKLSKFIMKLRVCG